MHGHYVNGVGLMTVIDCTIKYRSVKYIESKEPQDYLRALSAIVSRYNKAGYYVHMVYCDQEFKPIFKDAWDQLELTTSYANADDHVAEAERNNWFLKERFRTKSHYLPFKNIPRLMIRGLAIQVAKEANYFPVKNGVSSSFSPKQLIELQVLNLPTIWVFHLGPMWKQQRKPSIHLELELGVLFIYLFQIMCKAVMKLWL